MPDKPDINIVSAAIARAKRSMTGVILFSFIVNLLLLTSPIFMLQMYDRVLLSKSSSTLVGLLAVALFALLLLLFFEVIRNLLLNRISVRFNNDLAQITFSQVMQTSPVSKPIQDLNAVRSFLNTPYLLALFDIPWLPLYLGLVYFLHPMLGHIGLVGALVLFLLALSNDKLTKEDSKKSGEYFGAANAFVEQSTKNKDAIIGMGMLPSLSALWTQFQEAGLGYLIRFSDRNAWISSTAKVIRQVVQILILAVGAYLTIDGITTAGVMIAASIIVGRALAPIEQSIQGWRSLSKTKEASEDLKEFLKDFEPLKPGTPLPVPEGKIELQNVVALANGRTSLDESDRPVIKGLSMQINPGEAVGITGPSGSGKSTLARLILGVIRPINGSIKIDGAELSEEVQKQYSAYFGYVPQNVELFDGTIAENIARFREGSPDRVVEAAKLSGAYSLIVAMPEGFETKVGPGGASLSGGQRQRIALARALYETPPIVVLDEPTSNMDNEGRLVLQEAIIKLKQLKKTVVLIAHQPVLFSAMDKMAFVVDGQLAKYGPAGEILAELNGAKREGQKDGKINEKADGNKPAQGVKSAVVPRKVSVKPNIKPVR